MNSKPYLGGIKSILADLDTFMLWGISWVTSSPKKTEVIHQFIKFAIIGVINTAIDFVIYYYLTRYTHAFDVHTARKYLANAISFSVATTFSYFTNRTWTFKRNHGPTLDEAGRFYSTTGSALILNELLLLLLIKGFGVFDLVAKVFSTLVTIVWNFVFKKLWVFNEKYMQIVEVK